MRVSCSKYGLPLWYSLEWQLWLLERYISSVSCTVNDMWLLIEPISWRMTSLYLNVIKGHHHHWWWYLYSKNFLKFYNCHTLLIFQLQLFLTPQLNYFKSMDSFELFLFHCHFCNIIDIYDDIMFLFSKIYC